MVRSFTVLTLILLSLGWNPAQAYELPPGPPPETRPELLPPPVAPAAARQWRLFPKKTSKSDARPKDEAASSSDADSPANTGKHWQVFRKPAVRNEVQATQEASTASHASLIRTTSASKTDAHLPEEAAARSRGGCANGACSSGTCSSGACSSGVCSSGACAGAAKHWHLFDGHHPEEGATCCDKVCGPPARTWFGAEYLLWWTRTGSFPPLATTAPPGTPIATAGLVGDPATTILFPNGDNDNPRSGGRFTAGFWIDREQTAGIQARFFFLNTETTHFSATPADTSILMIPFLDPTGAQRRFVTIFPGAVNGSLNIDTSSRFYGGDVDVLCNMCCGCNCRLDGLIGWRTLRLNEDFRLLDKEANVLGNSVTASDQFSADNQFNGLDLGLQGEWRHGRLFVNGLAKVSLGVNHQQVTINGASLVNGAFQPGGLFALSSNIGNYSRDVFAVAPEANINVGVQLTSHVRAMVGYSFLYINNVARPGAQIDTTINPNLLPPAIAGGPARPAFDFKDSDFWAQGVNAGLQIRW